MNAVEKKPLAIAIEVAEQEFLRFVELMDLDLDTKSMSAEDLDGFNKQKQRIIKAISAGHLAINDKGEPVFTPRESENKTPLTFHEPTGASLMAMDTKKKNQDVSKLFSVMADMTKTDAKLFSKMAMRDLNVCTAVTTLFLG